EKSCLPRLHSCNEGKSFHKQRANSTFPKVLLHLSSPVNPMNEPTTEPSHSSQIPIFWIVQIAIWSLAVLVGTFVTIHWWLPLREALSFSLLRAAMGFVATSFLFRPLLRR